MIMDEFLEFADAVALTSSTSTDSAIFGDVVDLQPNGATNTLLDMGAGRPIYFVVSIDTLVAGVSGTTQFKLCSDSTANLATSKTTHVTSPTFTTAQMVKGFTWACPLPPNCDYERYLGVWTEQATATITAGKANCFLTFEPPEHTQYNDAVSQNA